MTEHTAVLDRFEGETAVLLLERDGEIVDELLVERSALPEVGREQDAVFRVAIEDGDLAELSYDPEATETRAMRAQSRFDRLSERPPTGDEPD